MQKQHINHTSARMKKNNMTNVRTCVCVCVPVQFQSLRQPHTVTQYLLTQDLE